MTAEASARPVNGTAPRIKAMARVELELLGTVRMWSDAYRLLVDELKFTVDELASPRGRRLYRAIDAAYQEHGAAPTPAQLAAYGKDLEQLDVDALVNVDPTADLETVRALVAEIRKHNAEQQRKMRVAEAESAFKRGQVELARDILDEVKSGVVSKIRVLGTSEIFAPLPESTWKVRGLHIGPGRPTVLLGYGASAKTLCAQALGLAIAAGRPVWGFFESFDAGRVLHLDYEQGEYATRKRYQRLALGYDIDESQLGQRLKLACFPRVFLDAAGAADEYCRLCEGMDVVLVDSLKAASPTRDENDSQIRSCLDVLTHASDKTGAAFIVLHHAGKPKDYDSDARMIGRGSSAIFDASGCVLAIVAKEDAAAPRGVRQTKQPAEAVGGLIEPFELTVEDVAVGDDQTGGVRVRYQPVVTPDASEMSDKLWQRDCDRLIATIRQNPGMTSSACCAKAAINKSRGLGVLEYLESKSLVIALPGNRGARIYRVQN